MSLLMKRVACFVWGCVESENGRRWLSTAAPQLCVCVCVCALSTRLSGGGCNYFRFSLKRRCGVADTEQAENRTDR